jgi:hypothetical protein
MLRPGYDTWTDLQSATGSQAVERSAAVDENRMRGRAKSLSDQFEGVGPRRQSHGQCSKCLPRFHLQPWAHIPNPTKKVPRRPEPPCRHKETCQNLLNERRNASRGTKWWLFPTLQCSRFQVSLWMICSLLEDKASIVPHHHPPNTRPAAVTATHSDEMLTLSFNDYSFQEFTS